MIYILVFCIVFIFSCSVPLKTSEYSISPKPDKIKVNYSSIDLPDSLKETVLIDQYRTINTRPILSGDKLIYTTKNGRFFSYDLKEQKMIEKESFSFGTNISPLVFENELYLFSSVGKEAIQAFQAGEKKWVKDIPYGIESTPFIDKSGIYIAAANGKVYKLERSTGKLVWEIQLKKPVHSDINAFFDLIIISDDSGQIVGVDKQSGNEIWNIKTNTQPSYTKPILVGNRLIYTTISGYIAEINPLLGKISWERNIGSPIYSTPSSDGKYLYFGSNNKNVYQMDFDGNIVNTFETESNVNAQILVGNKNLYFGTGKGRFYILDKSSFKVKWKRVFKGRFIASPLFWEDNLILFSDNDDVFMISEKEVSETASL